jgi:putative membrane protein
MLNDFNPIYLLNAIVYATLGIVIFAASFAILDRLTPYSLWKEIVEEKNTALAILVGLVALGICIIIAAAVH